MLPLQELKEKDSVFVAVEYENKNLLNTVKDAAQKKFGDKSSYVKNLWVLKEYKKRGGKVKYSGKRPSQDQIKKNVEKDVKRLRSEASFEIDLTNTALALFLKPEYDFVKASTDEDIQSLREDLETFEYCYEDDDFMKDFIETEAGEKKKNVKLNKPFRTPGGPKKFGVYVKNDKGNIVLVRFGDSQMEIRRDNPERRKSFRARHNCENPGPRFKAKFWSCKMWSSKKVSSIAEVQEENYNGIFDEYEEYTEAPLPTPSKNQNEKDFISSCMGNETMLKEYPDEKKRAAVCYSQFKDKD
jgi:hypothetical protein